MCINFYNFFIFSVRDILIYLYHGKYKLIYVEKYQDIHHDTSKEFTLYSTIRVTNNTNNCSFYVICTTST